MYMYLAPDKQQRERTLKTFQQVSWCLPNWEVLVLSFKCYLQSKPFLTVFDLMHKSRFCFLCSSIPDIVDIRPINYVNKKQSQAKV